ncbi:MAG: efflux RND transporter periplasmic adaptor subunit [Desulfobacteraceae bacterium]|nr:efflux RND transporter periplasmic adaptor subunit [Desulfobacteraceae bacterium]
MAQNTSNTPFHSPKALFVRRLWGALPLLSLIFLIGIIAILFFWIKSEGETLKEKKASELGNKQAPVNVVTLEVIPGLIQERLNLPGVVQPWVKLSVVSEIRGKIVAKKISEGRRVKPGDLLAVVESRDYKNAYNSARASYRAALSNQKRIVALFKDQLATQTQLDDVVAQMETTKANMDIAELNLERCQIRSPIEGVIDDIHIETGQYVDNGNAIADILQIEKVKVKVDIPESDIDAVRRVDNFRVAVDALNGKVFQGRRHHITRSADNLAHTYRLEIAVENPNGDILPDMFTRVKIIKRQVQSGLAVPMFSLIEQQDSKAVYVAENGTARLKSVTTGIQQGWQVHISLGLQPGDKVIVVGQRDIKDGAPINVIKTVQNPRELDL